MLMFKHLEMGEICVCVQPWLEIKTPCYNIDSYLSFLYSNLNLHILRGFWVDTTAKQAAKSQTNILQVISFVEGLFSHFWSECLFCAAYLAFVRSELTAVASLLLLHPQSPLVCIRENLSQHKHPWPPFWGTQSFISGTCRKKTSVKCTVACNLTVRILLCLVVKLPIQKVMKIFICLSCL